MKLSPSKIVLAAYVCFFAHTSFAGTEACKTPNLVLKCESHYKLSPGTAPSIFDGPNASAKVEDIQPEPFDPSECQASVVLFTYGGRLVVTYSEDTKSLHSWMESNGVVSTIFEKQPISTESPVKKSIRSPFKGIVDTIEVDCTVKE